MLMADEMGTNTNMVNDKSAGNKLFYKSSNEWSDVTIKKKRFTRKQESSPNTTAASLQGCCTKMESVESPKRSGMPLGKSSRRSN